MKHFIDSRARGVDLLRILGIVAALAAAIAVSGCITVPAGTDEAFAADARILEIVAADQEQELAERAPDDATRKRIERERLYGEWLDNLQDDLAETTDTARLRPAFVEYGFLVEQSIREFDRPLDTWAARGAERAKWIRQSIANKRQTLDALRAAQITLEDTNGTR